MDVNHLVIRFIDNMQGYFSNAELLCWYYWGICQMEL